VSQHRPKGWARIYWDIVEHFYWAPQYLGLKSIPQRYWVKSDDRVSVPQEMTNPDGPLYRRLRKINAFWPYVQRQEETFNHVFDIATAILPPSELAALFCPLAGMPGHQGLEALGQDIRPRYNWGEHENITAPDAMLVSPVTALAVELKFNAKTSLDQLAKYIGLLMMEEKNQGARTHLGLL